MSVDCPTLAERTASTASMRAPPAARGRFGTRAQHAAQALSSNVAGAQGSGATQELQRLPLISMRGLDSSRAIANGGAPACSPQHLRLAVRGARRLTATANSPRCTRRPCQCYATGALTRAAGKSHPIAVKNMSRAAARRAPSRCARTRLTEEIRVSLNFSASVRIGMLSLTMLSTRSSPTACAAPAQSWGSQAEQRGVKARALLWLPGRRPLPAPGRPTTKQRRGWDGALLSTRSSPSSCARPERRRPDGHHPTQRRVLMSRMLQAQQERQASPGPFPRLLHAQPPSYTANICPRKI